MYEHGLHIGIGKSICMINGCNASEGAGAYVW